MNRFSFSSRALRAVELLIMVLVVAVLSGCAGLSRFQDAQALLNPVRINETTAKSGRVHNAMQAPVDAYYAALKAAESDYSKHPARHAEPLQVVDYVDAGIGLTYAYCRRWFHVIGDTKRKRELGEGDFNIIRDGIVAIMGLAGASPAAIGLYGIGNTIVTGMNSNFDDAILTAPAQRKVQVKVMEMLDSVAVPLRASSGTLTFLQAYTALEALADVCTFPTIRDAVDDALSVTITTVHPVSGAITSTPKVAP